MARGWGLGQFVCRFARLGPQFKLASQLAPRDALMLQLTAATRAQNRRVLLPRGALLVQSQMGMERRMQALKELGAQRTVYDAERAAYSSGFEAGEERAERSVMLDDRSAKVLELRLSRSGGLPETAGVFDWSKFDACCQQHRQR